jgi:hypothetical protein
MAALGLILLLVFVVDATVLGHRLVAYLARHPSGWPSALLYKHAQERNLPVTLDGVESPGREALAQWLMIRLIADSTDVVSHFIYYPFVVLLVLVVAQNPLFVPWDWNIPLISIALVSAGTALLCAVVLQRSARDARTKAQEAIDRQLAPLAGRDEDKATREKLLLFRTEIEGMDSGVFANLAQNPVVHALLLPVAGGGGLAALEALLPHL